MVFFTEYLGFQAYDGEYKVMGLAAYGKHNKEIKDKIDRLLWYDEEGGFILNVYSKGSLHFCASPIAHTLKV